MMEIDSVFNKFSSLTANAEKYLSSQVHLVSTFEKITKSLYDYGKSIENKISENKSISLHKLITKNFDNEQIWQQIELQNKPSLIHLKKKISHLKQDYQLNKLNKKKKKELITKESLDIQKIAKKKAKNLKTSEISEMTKSSKKKVRFETSAKTEVDDKFFSLAEMEQFLDNEEMKESKDRVDESSDEEIDYFTNLSNEEEEDDDDEVADEEEPKYEDFFDSIEEKEEEMSVDNSSTSESEVELLKDNEKYDTRDVSDKMIEDGKNVSDEKSNFQIQQERLQMKMRKMEEEQLQKPWQLRGELLASARPENCLLEEDLTFEHVTRQPPPITEEVTTKLEDIIKQRIKDMAWDDVEKKVKLPEQPFQYQKHITVEDKKNELSLAEVYEQEYLKKQKTEEEETEKEEPKEIVEIRNAMTSLFAKLDALSHYHFHPRPPVPDMKVVSNLPAVTVEDPTPIGASDQMLLAPEEVKTKSKGITKSTEERTTTDKKRERRKKKLFQKFKNKQKNKKMVGSKRFTKLESLVPSKKKKDVMHKRKKITY